MKYGQLIKCLRELAQGAEPSDLSCGICWDIYHKVGRIEREEFKYSCPSWPEYSGLFFYPVKHPDYDDPGDAYHYADRTLTMWVGEYGERRRALAGWVADYIEESIKL